METPAKPIEQLVQSGTMEDSAGDDASVWNVSVYSSNMIDWYVVASIHQSQGKKNRYFRVGRFDSQERAFEQAKAVVPQKLSKTKKVGTIDLYRNRTWRVRIKYVKENLHIGYFIKKKDAHKTMLKLMNDSKYLSSRFEDLNRKRQQNKVRLTQASEFEYATGKKRWTKDDVTLLTKLRDQSTPWESVARRLGRTIEACKSRIWRQSSENLREGERGFEYIDSEPKTRPSRKKIAVKKEESGRLSIPNIQMRFTERPQRFRRSPNRVPTPPRLPIKRRLDDDLDVTRRRKKQANWNSQPTNYVIKRESEPPLSPYTFNVSEDYPTSPRLDDDDDDFSPRDSNAQWFAEVKKQPHWSSTLSFQGTEETFPSTFVDFLKDDSPPSHDSKKKLEKTSLFEIPSSSLNVEVKEESEEKDPWSNFFFKGSNAFLPRFNVAIAAKVNETSEWWLDH